MGKFFYLDHSWLSKNDILDTPPSCRYHPSCSQYTLEAIRVHGVFKGTWLGSLRILDAIPLVDMVSILFHLK